MPERQTAAPAQTLELPGPCGTVDLPYSEMQFSKYRSPVGDIRMLASEAGLAAVYFPKQSGSLESKLAPGGLEKGHGNVFLLQAEAFLACYFDGDLDYSPGIPLDLQGTPFQIRVWRAIAAIPPGDRLSYRDLAEGLGRPSAVRAAGRAVGANPLSIVIPCHRVVGSDGRLTGYAGGLAVKRYLLEHEARHSAGMAS